MAQQERKHVDEPKLEAQERDSEAHGNIEANSEASLKGRRTTDKPVSAPEKWLQHLSVLGMALGVFFSILLVGSEGVNKLFSVGLAFLAGGLAVWRLIADDLQRSVKAVQEKDAKIRRLMANIEELEDKAWELGESDERHASILSTLGDVVIRRDQNGIITYVNSAAGDVFGAEHALQSGLPMILPQAGETESEADKNDTEIQERSGFQDLKLKTNGGTRWYSRLDVPVRDPLSGDQLVQTVLRDVTERRVIEEELLAARQSAESSSESKSRFLATVSHEIRTPLNGVMGMTSLLRDTRLTKEQLAYIDALETSGETLLLLIDEVLDFSKVEAGKLDIHATSTRAGALVENVIELLAPKAHVKSLEIGSFIDPSLPDDITLDPIRVRQILFNLIGNAIKFTDKGGVSVELRGLNNPAGGSFLEISVLDTGIGFSQEEADRLFREFEQVDHGPARKFGGTGLGLAIAQRLAGLMKGSIQASPVEGGGALFKVTLPIPEELLTNPGGKLAVAADKNVVFVTGNAIECQLLGRLLKAHGAKTTILEPGSSNVENALATADLVVVDNAALSDSGGWLATARLAGCTGSAVVLISPSERDRLDNLRQAGYAAYLIRPVRIETLVHVFAGLLSGDGIENAWNVSAAPVSASTGSKDKGSASRPLRLLVAEDNDINRLLSEALLRKLGHVPVMVVDGEKAVAEAAGGDYDAILMDLHMPGVDGFQAIQQIRAAEREAGRPEVPVLIVTADVMKDARDKAESVGASGYLTKPLSMDTISDALTNVCRPEADM